ncbi:MAG: C39 family peptidase [Methanoregula sp.]|nr:C39 family peptidase [Methanoregula sp.]
MKLIDAVVLCVVIIALLVAAYVLLIVLPGTTSGAGSPQVSAVSAETTADEGVMLVGVPDVMQAEYYSCGAAAFQAVLNYYGLIACETELRTRLNTTPGHGTYPWDIVNASQKLGFAAEWRENVTLNDVESSLKSGVPVIIDGQRFKAANSTWNETWNTGHYMVIYGIDKNTVYLEDPAILGSRLAVPRDEFVSLWHDYECELPVPADAHRYYQLGIFINGTVPAHRAGTINITDSYQMIGPEGIETVG